MNRGWQIDDAARLATMADFGLLDPPPPEERFDEIAAAAAAVCDAPVGLVTLVGRDTQYFKAHAGTDLTQTPVDIAICRHTLETGGELVIPDLAEDPRTADNPLVTTDPKVRFYAGTPIVLDGQAVGTICVLDLVPRLAGLQPHQRRGLAALAVDAARMFAER